MPPRRTQSNQKPDPVGKSVALAAPEIDVSITNERGQQYQYHARTVSLRMKRGEVRIIERERGCYVWFEGCNLEVRDGRRNILFHLLAGSASSNGTDLTIIAEIAHPPGDAAVAHHSLCKPTRTARAPRV